MGEGRAPDTTIVGARVAGDATTGAAGAASEAGDADDAASV